MHRFSGLHRIGQCALLASLFFGCLTVSGQADDPAASSTADSDFPRELVDFQPYEGNPVFAGTGTDTWDRSIRERGFVLRDPQGYRLWYTGYSGVRTDPKYLGLATSADGIHWSRDPANPIFDKSWVEDICVIRHEANMYLFAEGRDDIAHQMTSLDGRTWREEGKLDIRQTDGQPISAGPYGTPTVWYENNVWHLFFERRDAGVWLARSTDRRTWTLVQDEPILRPGPDRYDRAAIALNQIVKYDGRYVAYYHGTADEPWKDWCTNVAMSSDLVHWRKYPHNPLVAGDRSSGIVVHDGDRFRLYTMHPDVRLYWGYRGEPSREAGGHR
jgi:hypothetical protein